MGIPIGANLNQGVYHPENQVTSPAPPPPVQTPAQALAEHLAIINQGSQAASATPGEFEDTSSPNASLASMTPTYGGAGRLIDQLLARYNSPLAGKGWLFARKAKKYGLDARLLPSIAGAETSFMTNPNAAPWSDHNTFGMGGPHGSGGIEYPNWRAGIDAAARNLAENYLSEGRDTINEISSKWAPLSDSRDVNAVNQHWAGNVGQYWDELTKMGLKGNMSANALPKWAGGRGLIYDPEGYWFRGMSEPSTSAYGGHETHVHQDFTNPRLALRSLRIGQKRFDLTPGENPYVGKVYPVHAGTSAQFGDTSGTGDPSYHYRLFPGKWGPDNRQLGEAIDWTGTPENMAAFYNFMLARYTGSPNYDYGTTSSGGGGSSGGTWARPSTAMDVNNEQQSIDQSNDILGSSIASYAVPGGMARKKKRTAVDQLIDNLLNIQSGGGVYGA